jgi:hypothetical protein
MGSATLRIEGFPLGVSNQLHPVSTPVTSAEASTLCRLGYAYAAIRLNPGNIIVVMTLQKARSSPRVRIKLILRLHT